MEYGATVWDPYQKYNSHKVERVQRRAGRFVKSRYSRYSSVSDMHDVLGWTPLSQRRQDARLIINGLAQVDHTTSMYGQLFFLKLLVYGTGLFSRKLRHWLYLDQVFLTNSYFTLGCLAESNCQPGHHGASTISNNRHGPGC